MPTFVGRTVVSQFDDLIALLSHRVTAGYISIGEGGMAAKTVPWPAVAGRQPEA